MSTKPNHRRGHGRIQQAGCRIPGCWCCRMMPIEHAKHKQRRADVDAREQVSEALQPHEPEYDW